MDLNNLNGILYHIREIVSLPLTSFSGLPGGGKWHLSSGGIGLYLYWWASTPSYTEYTDGSWTMNLSYEDDTFLEIENHVKNGFSVRCIKD